MKINMKEWSNEILKSKERLALPVMTYPGLELIHRTIKDVVSDAQAQFECVQAVNKKYNSLGAVTIMDLSVEAEAFGSPVNFSDKEVPAITAAIVPDMDAANDLQIPMVGDKRTSVYIKAAELISENVTDRPTFSGIIGPFSLAGRLMDMTEIMMQALIEPEMVHVVLEKCTKFLIEYAKAYKNAGVNGVVIAEPAAGLLSPDMCTEFSSNYVKQIVAAVQDDSFCVMLHNCGNTTKLVDSMVSTGANALHFGNAVNMVDILPQVPSNIIVFGNIEPAGVFKNGTVDAMKLKVSELLNNTVSYNNFVLSSGCDLPPGTPLKNIDAFYEALSEFNLR